MTTFLTVPESVGAPLHPARLARPFPAGYVAGMRYLPLLVAVACSAFAGCSNAPVAGAMDTIFPSKPQRSRNPDPRDLFDRDKDALPPPELIPRDRDDSLPPPRTGGLRSNPRTEPEPRADPFRPRGDDSLPPPLPAPGFLDPIGPGRN